MRQWAGDQVLSIRSRFDHACLGLVYAVLAACGDARHESDALAQVRLVCNAGRKLGLIL